MFTTKDGAARWVTMSSPTSLPFAEDVTKISTNLSARDQDGQLRIPETLS